jgi:hypothetical protein
MRNLLLGLVAGTALALGSTAANAAETITPINSAILNSAGTSGPFGAVITGQTSFADMFAFTLDNTVSLDGQVGTISLGNLMNINFSTIYIDSMANAFTKTSATDAPETWALVSPVTLGSGPHTLFVNGNIPNGANSSASYSGTLNIGAAVPEPATWALMLLGFGGIGMVMRRRRRPGLTQLA